MRKILISSYGLLVTSGNLLREFFDPAFEASPYERASQQPKVDKVNYAPRLMPRRRIAVR